MILIILVCIFSDKPYLFYFDLVECARMGAVSALVSGGCPTPQVKKLLVIQNPAENRDHGLISQNLARDTKE